MVISSITLKNFRNHRYLTFDFSSKINILTGINGVGKTNVVEAIYYLSLARSFRVNDNNELIKKGKDASQIIAKIKEGDITRTIDITLTPDGRRILVNGKPINKLSQLVKITNIILFEPKDVLLFRGPPKERRNFLDISLSKKSEAYLDYISRYDKLLKQRNDILKSNKLDKLLLDATTEMLIKLEGPIVSYRQMYVKDINDILNTITRTLTGTHVHVVIVYTPFVKYNNLQQFEEEAKKAYSNQIENEIKSKTTLIGVHREDFYVKFNDSNIALSGSQGENRLIALALKLSSYFLIKDNDKKPIIVLDDVMSELDEENKKRLIKLLEKFEQVFITSTQLNINGAKQFQLKAKPKEDL